MSYVYDLEQVRSWMRMRKCRITAGDAAEILSTTREELLKHYGLKAIPVRSKEYSGKLIIDNGKNLYMWIPK